MTKHPPNFKRINYIFKRTAGLRNVASLLSQEINNHAFLIAQETNQSDCMFLERAVLLANKFTSIVRVLGDTELMPIATSMFWTL